MIRVLALGLLGYIFLQPAEPSNPCSGFTKLIESPFSNEISGTLPTDELRYLAWDAPAVTEQPQINGWRVYVSLGSQLTGSPVVKKYDVFPLGSIPWPDPMTSLLPLSSQATDFYQPNTLYFWRLTAFNCSLADGPFPALQPPRFRGESQ